MDGITQQKMEGHLGALKRRRKVDLLALHVLKTASGFQCLDYDLERPTWPELERAITEAHAKAPLFGILPSSPEEDWRLLMGDYERKDFFFLPIRLARGVWMAVVILGRRDGLG